MKTMQDMIEEILGLVDFNKSNREQNDVFRTNHCAARANGLTNALHYMGIVIDFGTWMDGEYEMVGYVYIDGVTLVKNGEINWRAYADAVHDEAHHWGSRVPAVEERS